MRAALVVFAVLVGWSCSSPPRVRGAQYASGRTPPVPQPDSPVPDDGAHLVVARGHGGNIRELAATPDGSRIATIADDRIARIFAADDLRELAHVFVPGALPYYLAISDDGTRVALNYAEWTSIFDVASGREIGRVKSSLNPCVAFDGDDVLVWRTDGLVRWHAGTVSPPLATGFTTCTALGRIDNLLVVYDGKQLVLGELTGTAWKAARAAISIEKAATVRIGPSLVAWSDRNGVYTWRPGDPAPTTRAALAATELWFVAGGTALIYSTFKGTVRVDLASNAVTPYEVTGELAALGATRVAVGDDETLCTEDARTLRVETCLRTSGGPVRSLLVTRSGNLIVGADHAQIRRWKLGFPTAMQRWSSWGAPAADGALALSPDKEEVAQADLQLVVHRVGVEQHRVVDPGSYSGIAWSPDGKWLATTRGRSIVRIPAAGGTPEVIPNAIPTVRANPWFIQHGEPDANANRRELHLVYRSDSGVLAVASDEYVIVVRGGAVVATLGGDEDGAFVTAIAFRPGSHELFAGFANGRLRAWDTDALARPPRETSIAAPVSAITFDPAGELLVAADDTRIHVVSAPAGGALRESRAFPAGPSTALALAILPHGRLATGHVDGVVRIFELATGALTAELYGLETDSDPASWLVVRPDGRFESSILGDGSQLYGMRDGRAVPFDAFAAPRRSSGLLEAALFDPKDRPARGPAGPRITVQNWSSQISEVEFTDDGRELLASAEDGVYAFDAASGLLRAHVAEAQPNGKLAIAQHTFFHSSSARLEHRSIDGGKLIAAANGFDQRVVGMTRSGLLVVRDGRSISLYSPTPLRAVQTVAEPLDYANPSDVAVSPGGDFVVSTAGDGIAHVRASADLHELAAVRCTSDAATRVAIDATGTWIACATSRRSVGLVRRDGSGAFVVRPDTFQGGLGYAMPVIYTLAFDPIKPLLAIAASDGLFAFDVADNGRPLALDADPTRYNGIAWSPDGSLLASAELSGTLQIFDAASGAKVHAMRSEGARVERIGRARAGELVIQENGGGASLRVWSVTDGRERVLDDGRAPNTFAWTSNGEVGAIVELAHGWSSDPGHLPPSIAIDAGGRKSRIDLPDASLVLYEAAIDHDRVYIASRGATDHDTKLTSYALATGATVWSKVVPGSVRTLRLAPTGELGVTLDVDDAQGLSHEHGEAIVFGRDGTAIASHDTPPDRGYYDLVALGRGDWLLAGHEIDAWNPRSGAVVPTDFTASRFSTSPGGTLVATADDHELHVLDAATGAIRASAELADAKVDECVFVTDRLIATRFDDDTIGMWRVRGSQLERAGRLVVAHERGVAFVATDGHYLATGEAVNALGVVLGDGVYQFDQFDATLNRPDLALSALGEASPTTLAIYEAAARKRQVVGAATDQLALSAHMSTVGLTEALPVRTSADRIAVHVRADAEPARLVSLNVRVNGVPVFGRNGIDMRAKRVSHVELAPDVPLEIGENRIELEALDDRGVLAVGHTAVVTREGMAKPGTLHVIAIGVSKYADASHDLAYAAKDAGDVAAALEKAFSPGVPVTKTILRDDQVTRAKILALRGELEHTELEDTVILFISGHGLLDPDDDRYMFATHDVSFDAPRANGVSFDELEGLLDGIPARRRLLVLDTCHAGELDAEELAYVEQAEQTGAKGVRRIRVKPPAAKPGIDPRTRAVAARAFFTQLRRGAGATVITASAGAEYSYEDGAIQNGQLTHALIDGLDGAADLDHDGAIHVSELVSYLAATVSQQTHGFQVPEARELNRDLDFDLTPAHPHKTFFTFDKCIGIGPMQLVKKTDGNLATLFTPDANISYQCGALVATSQPDAKSGPPAATLDATQKAIAAAFPTITFAAKESRAPSGAIVRELVGRVPGYAPAAQRAWLELDAKTHRLATCFALDAVPAAVERCRRALPALVLASPPQELP